MQDGVISVQKRYFEDRHNIREDVTPSYIAREK
jgi:hypothetical protein